MAAQNPRHPFGAASSFGKANETPSSKPVACNTTYPVSRLMRSTTRWTSISRADANVVRLRSLSFLT